MGGFFVKIGEWILIEFVKMGGLFRQNRGVDFNRIRQNGGLFRQGS